MYLKTNLNKKYKFGCLPAGFVANFYSHCLFIRIVIKIFVFSFTCLIQHKPWLFLPKCFQIQNYSSPTFVTVVGFVLASATCPFLADVDRWLLMSNEYQKAYRLSQIFVCNLLNIIPLWVLLWIPRLVDRHDCCRHVSQKNRHVSNTKTCRLSQLFLWNFLDMLWTNL